jgi:hypothetical protein
MANHIRELLMFDGRLDPVEAQVGISVYPERLISRTEVRGRLLGPRCPYATTVEVAYPWREAAREYETEGTPHISLRVIIPEPSLWEPESPFLYQGPVELWEHGQRCDQVIITHGLRSVKLGPQGLRWNGRPATIRGTAWHQPTFDEALPLRQVGINTLLAPITPEFPALVAAADRFGFWIVGWVHGPLEALKSAPALGHHTSLLGWVLAPDAWPQDLVRILAEAKFWRSTRGEPLVGAELNEAPANTLPKGIDFLFCDSDLLGSLAGIGLPKIIRTDKPPASERDRDDVLSCADLVGWIGVPETVTSKPSPGPRGSNP